LSQNKQTHSILKYFWRTQPLALAEARKASFIRPDFGQHTASTIQRRLSSMRWGTPSGSISVSGSGLAGRSR